MNTLDTLSLYIHFPWCVKKCPYCDFNSHNRPAVIPEKQYIQNLIDELESQRPLWTNKKIHTLFMGGGRPSLISAEQLSPLFDYFHSTMKMMPEAEITTEANPGTIDQIGFAAYRQLGVNRLSLGVQSFNDNALKKLGRIHDQAQIIKAFNVARKAGFDNINLDIMFALPEQTQTQALNDLQVAISLKPEHISWYQLTLEPNTLFHRFPPILPDNDLAANMQQHGQQLLKHHGYHQYEVSAYAQPHRQCQHNLQYWTFGDYLGIGAGAHSKITTVAPHSVTRHWNYKNPRDYMSPSLSYKENESIIDNQSLLFEFFLNRFRLKQPLLEQELITKTGYNFLSINNILMQLKQKKLIKLTGDKLNLTRKGENFLNDVVEHWL